jgi:hypothetical protein
MRLPIVSQITMYHKRNLRQALVPNNELERKIILLKIIDFIKYEKSKSLGYKHSFPPENRNTLLTIPLSK